mmetsp:Transcript_82483/g.256163  ORF Transcript_82483/g.256163 Transcript_82483/m.256163 type:complete len:112 (+) Transcript_82483:96-431(+)|eukprot:CAMPEP_0204533310 /NCGR_PEP_ID=MMETSP0661-20131031/12217_1 /ASSEMBLY_ACC=CAM_ASM_000606 /TAXON_ID=109239 /ORGANISM="Alexandrium margalefi, Strain AMGDE01CS-322" /LENGTH=111 /DNA_ID=CAMNT_0051539643 /DNA_START=85 /DNA_END=420 /DNA_ORIENTATION=-
MASASASAGRRARLPALALLLGALLLASWALQAPGFVSPRTAAAPRTSAVSRDAKSLFERTKDLNEKLQEANSENELLVDTDSFWSIGYLVAGGLATWGFVQLLYSLKPTE